MHTAVGILQLLLVWQFLDNAADASVDKIGEYREMDK
jgi:hypothetical protein